ncbi:hypothetical protein NPIL_223441 [Nephila pilipes]|uniref:Uncharacterized protein n=1 Tax=Nephila pilipes TaxID=299642 RepID=A0A8X6IQL8_NEPPI|nr:hypothetical protein NPIL_223441 [Nephila pilipes]
MQSTRRSYAFSVIIFHAVVEGFDVLSGDTGVHCSGSVTFLRDFAVFQQQDISDGITHISHVTKVYHLQQVGNPKKQERKSTKKRFPHKLGERVTDDLKIIHLKNLIINSTNYEEELVREILIARIQERMKASSSHVCENYNAMEGHNSNPFELRKLPKCTAKEDDKIEIAENIAEDTENILP